MKNHKNKVLMLLSAMFLFSIILALNSNAAGIDCNVTTTNIKDKTDINVTYNSTSGWHNVTIALYMRSSSTANSSDSFIANFSNTSNRNHANFTISSEIVLEDSNNYNAYATCYGNATGITSGDMTGNSSLLTGITVDRTAPSTPTAISPTGTQSNNTLDFVSTIIGANTIECTLEFIGQIPNGASLKNAMTHSGNLCTARYTSVSDLTYQYKIIQSDGTNLSTTISQYITVGSDEPNLQGLGALKQVEVEVGQKQKKSNNNTFYLVILVVVIIYFASKKKGR